MNIKYFKIGFVLAIFLLITSCGGDKKDPQVATNDSLALATNDGPGYYQRALEYMKVQRYGDAITDLKAAIHLDTNNMAYYHALSDSYLENMESRKALETIKLYSNMFPDNIDNLKKMARFQYIFKQFDNSVLTLNEIIRRNNTDPDAFFLLGLNFRDMGDFDRAINALKTAVENDAEMVDGWIILGELHEKSDPKMAEIYFKNAMDVSKGSPHAKHAYAYFLQNSDRIEEAITLYKEMHVDAPDYIPAYLNAGILFMENDSLDRAIEEFSIIIGRVPQDDGGYIYRSEAYTLKGDFEAALADANTALRLNDKSTKAIRLKDKIEYLMTSDALD